MNIREKNLSIIENNSFDVLIIGGGINGASIYRELCQKGYKILLIDKGDFSYGTSQASAMMIWGGLLYLKNLDFASVYKLSKDRDKMIDAFPDSITKKHFRYISNNVWGRNKYFAYLALYFYWILGGFRRDKIKFQKKFDELEFLNHENSNESILYEEAVLKQSDSRLVLDWIFNNQTENHLAINYCSILNANYNNKDQLWTVDCKDNFSSRQSSIKTKLILNCAGVWTDKVNEQFGIQSPYKHVFSKGVFIAYERPKNHKDPLIFEMGEKGDTLTLIPWGPVSLWGPTETKVNSIEEGYKIVPEDVLFLIKHAARNLKPRLAHSRIISMRCGLRPLVVKKEFNFDCYPLDISRKYKIVVDRTLPWISVYGGKISGCISLAQEVASKVRKKVSPNKQKCFIHNYRKEEITKTFFPGFQEKVPSIEWCVKHEFCCTLEDYLRRRTNISQWIPREGLGFENENLDFLKDLTSALPILNKKSNDMHLIDYISKVNEDFDKIIELINKKII